MRPEEVERYFENLEKEVRREWEIAARARERGFDPELEPEIQITRDFAERVEKLLGIPGLAEEIRKMEREMSREELAIRMVERLVERETGLSDEVICEKALRLALAIITEAVPIAAVVEGITKTEIRRNPNGSRYLAIHFASPIRAAGGTAAALAILIGDLVRRKLHLSAYAPTVEEIERYVEETEIYAEVERLQFTPSADDIRLAVSNLPVEVTGEPTHKNIVVTTYRDLPRVGHNYLRGGAILALVEGVLQKAPKLLKYVELLGLDGWEWLQKIAQKMQVVEEEERTEEEIEDEEEDAGERYLEEVIAGRPVFSHPKSPGGFRLRYGRARNTGYATVGMNPATMYILDDFLAVGTQLKTEFPGKAATVAPVDTIEGPLVKLKDGSVIRVSSPELAKRIRSEIEEILFTGDILISFGEFLENNHPILPPAWCEEWWAKEVKVRVPEGELKKIEEFLRPPYPTPPPSIAIELSEKYGVPLHPAYTYDYERVSCEQLFELAQWLSSGKLCEGENVSLELQADPRKRILEILGVPHRVRGDKVILEEHALPLIRCLGIASGKKHVLLSETDALEAVQKIAGFPIYRRSPTVVGVRMGRPEKASPRKMDPPPHVLFPISLMGGPTRNIVKAMDKIQREKTELFIEVVRLVCPRCGEITIRRKCEKCGSVTEFVKIYPCCKRPAGDSERCPVHYERSTYWDKRAVPLNDLLREATERLGVPLPEEIKGVKGLTSLYRFPEPLEKGILRARHGVYVFKDGTIRYDLTNLPLTHFRPREIGTSVERLRELGYERDVHGNPLMSDDQLLELKVQDIIIPRDCAEYLLKVCNFIDDLLEKFYGLPRFYNAKGPEDLIGHLVVALAPHTSVGVVARIIGFTGASVCFAVPFLHAAKRRDADGDQDSIMLLLDAFLNFSQKFLPEKRGGMMDAPLMLTIRVDPLEVDKQAHRVEVSSDLPLEFYHQAAGKSPSEVVKLGWVEVVESRLQTERKYEFGFQFDTSNIACGPLSSSYKSFNSMEEKTRAQLALARKIRAVDENDVAKRLLEHHFLPDIRGNLRTFTCQTFRCSSCNTKYRRVPLTGVCRECGGNLVLTVSRGGIEKYLNIAREIAEEFEVGEYLRQRIKLIEGEIRSMFREEPQRQLSLSDFLLP